MTMWPYNQPNGTFTYNLGYALQQADLASIRQIVQEEVHKALHPEEAQPSATVEVEQDGKLYRGTVYLVEDEDEDEKQVRRYTCHQMI